jgi:hypothetical protein
MGSLTVAGDSGRGAPDATARVRHATATIGERLVARSQITKSAIAIR